MSRKEVESEEMGLHGCSSNGGSLDDSKFSEPMPWIGVYVAAASLACTLAMGSDAYRGIRHRKLWFPNVYFSLNAASLSLLSIATKFPVDLNTSMPRCQDQLAKLTGTVFLCTAMGNFMPSLGAMEETETLMNVVALCILVITVVVNIGIQMGTGLIYVFIPEHAAIMFIMLVLLVILGFSALTTPTSKQLLEKQFKYKHQATCDTGLNKDGTIIFEKLKDDVKKYWVMAVTSSPQYVLGRSAMSTASGAFCLFAALILVEAAVRSLVTKSLWFCGGESDYKWSSTLVLISQAVAIVVGTIAPALRWFNAACFANLQKGVGSFRKELRVERWWILRFLETKEKHLPFGIHSIRSRRIRKIACISKNQILDILIAIQTALVLISKSVRLISVVILCSLCSLKHFFLNFFCKRLLRKLATGENISRASGSNSDLSSSSNITDFVLHLEGEEKLVQLIARNGCERTDEWIKNARKHQPTNLLDLLRNSTASQGFKGVFEFDSDQVPSIASAEPPNCWALPVATLTSIAVALHYNNKSAIECLLRGVHEGFGYVRLVEKTLDAKGLIHMKEAADCIWFNVDVHNRWFGVKLRKFASEGKSSKEVLEELADAGKKHVLEYIQRMGKKKDPHHWPPKVLAANSMYRICQTILQDYKFDADEKLFGRLQRMIADIFAACFTNLPHVISTKCLCTAVEVRIKNVVAAVQLLGEAENIILVVGQKACFDLNPNQMAYIDEWRLAKQKNTPVFVSPDDDVSKLCFNSEELSLYIE